MFIDAHVHITNDGKWFDTDIDASLARLLRELDQSLVKKVVILPLEGVTSNEYVAAVCRKYPDRLIGFATVNPLDGTNSVSELVHAINSLGLRGLKLHPRLQHFSPSDDRILPVLHKAGELGVPVVFDVFPQGPGLIKEILPLNYDWIAKTVPKTKIILAHSGGSRILDALLVAKANSNVYLDLSYSLLYYQGSSVLGDFLFAVKKIGAQRVIYGSDYPEVGIVESFEKVGEILDGLFIHEREWVFGKTISSLLNLE